MNTQGWEDFLRRGIDAGAYPCYAAAVGRGKELFFKSIGGDRTCSPERLPLTENTLFDLASLSKLVGTTFAALRLMEQGKLHLADTLGDYFDDCYGKEDITVKHLMTHTSGMAGYAPIWKMDITPADATDAILAYPLAAPTGEKVIYSCTGYIVLGKILEKICGEPLDKIVKREVTEPLGMRDTLYCPSADSVCAATENLCGVVHDENARFLGGVSGNAGLFSTLDDTISFAQMLSDGAMGYLDPKIFALATTDHTKDLPDFSRGLGFLLYRGGDFVAGSQMSLGSYGHTGFTGTSLFVDKESGIFCILLTNRVHFGRDNQAFFPYRRGFYDMVFSDIRGIIK